MTLRSKLIRLAHENPELRSELLPLLKEAARGWGGRGDPHSSTYKTEWEIRNDGREVVQALSRFQIVVMRASHSGSFDEEGKRLLNDLFQRTKEAEELISRSAANFVMGKWNAPESLRKEAAGEPLFILDLKKAGIRLTAPKEPSKAWTSKKWSDTDVADALEKAGWKTDSSNLEHGGFRSQHKLSKNGEKVEVATATSNGLGVRVW